MYVGPNLVQRDTWKKKWLALRWSMQSLFGQGRWTNIEPTVCRYLSRSDSCAKWHQAIVICQRRAMQQNANVDQTNDSYLGRYNSLAQKTVFINLNCFLICERCGPWAFCLYMRLQMYIQLLNYNVNLHFFQICHPHLNFLFSLLYLHIIVEYNI